MHIDRKKKKQERLKHKKEKNNSQFNGIGTVR